MYADCYSQVEFVVINLFHRLILELEQGNGCSCCTCVLNIVI
jgi:hypothetical protein